MDTHMRRKVMELVDNVKTKMTDQEYIEFCALLKKNEAYEPVNLEGATLVKIKFNHIEIDCEDMPDITELNVKEYTSIVQVVSEEENELGATNLIFRGIASMKRLETFVKRINWRNDMEQVGHEDGTSSLEKVGKTVKNFCYEGVEGLFNEWIEPLEIEVLSRDKQFSK